MSLKDSIENNLSIWAGGLLIAGFLGGIGTMSFLEAREDRLRQQIIDDLKSENSSLKLAQDASTAELQNLKKANEQLLAEAKELLAQSIEKRLEGQSPTGAYDAIIREGIDKAIEQDGIGAIPAINSNPAAELGISTLPAPGR